MTLVINGQQQSVMDGLTLSALLDQLGMKSDRVAVELNHGIVVRNLWPETHLKQGDELEIVHFVGGGTRNFSEEP